MTNTDQLGIMLAGMITPIRTFSFAKEIVIDDNGGTPRAVRVWGTNAQNRFGLSTGNGSASVQVGKGLSPATRQDVNIESPFTNGGVEDNPVLTQVFGYNSGLGKVTVATMITPTAGAGAITEVIHFSLWQDTGGINRFFLTQRDQISVVNFISGETINVEHIWLI